MTMLADAPMRVPLPPKHAPNASAHASGSMLSPTTSATIFCMTGTMVAVKGMLSTKAENMAEAHTIRHSAASCRALISMPPIISLSTFAIARRRPSSPTPSTTTKRAAKKRSVSHSTVISASWQWWRSKMVRSHTAPRIDTHAGSKCVTGWRKKERMTQKRTAPHLTSSTRFVIGYIFCRWGMSATRTGSAKASLKYHRRKAYAKGAVMITPGARLMRKAVKSRYSESMLPMMMFGGSPIMVAVPPMLEKIASEMR
mmetsp:Transcript_58688/g.138301  ORF Transcript_58688/g.138301 Transcript_58688/m.138301 type:complete len:256 (+) Transcript_58688:617-1384(+)